MKIHNPDTVIAPVSSYSHGIEVPPDARRLYISGQVGIDLSGNTPHSFAEQCTLVWTNLYNVLASADMDRNNLVKLTVYMTDPNDLPDFRKIRDEFLQDSRPATTLLFITQLADPVWRLEIEGVGAKSD